MPGACAGGGYRHLQQGAVNCSRTSSGAGEPETDLRHRNRHQQHRSGLWKRHNIAVTNVAGYSTVSVAQHTLRCTSIWQKNSCYYDDYVKRQLRRQQSFHLHGQTVHRAGGQDVGIIGLGAIGEKWLRLHRHSAAGVIYYSTSGTI